MSQEWICIRKEVSLSGVMRPDEEIITAFPFRDYVLVISNRGEVFKLWHDSLDDNVIAGRTEALFEQRNEPDPELVEAIAAALNITRKEST